MSDRSDRGGGEVKIKLTVQYHGQLRQIAGMEAENGDYPEQTTLPEILGEVAARHDAVFNQIVLDDEGRVRRSLMVLINDEAIDRDSAQKLQDGDIISLFPAISGG